MIEESCLQFQNFNSIWLCVFNHVSRLFKNSNFQNTLVQYSFLNKIFKLSYFITRTKLIRFQQRVLLSQNIIFKLSSKPDYVSDCPNRFNWSNLLFAQIDKYLQIYLWVSFSPTLYPFQAKWELVWPGWPRSQLRDPTNQKANRRLNQWEAKQIRQPAKPGLWLP